MRQVDSVTVSVVVDNTTDMLSTRPPRHIRGKGLAIFTGCSHAGIINICHHAQDLFPGTPLYALVGGLHLVYPNEDLIDATIAELKKFNLSVIVPGHCTGWRAVHAFVKAFGEDTVDPLAVGTRQSL